MFKKLLKVGIAVTIVLVLIIAGLAFWAYSNINELVRWQTEVQMAHALMVPVKVGAAEVNLSDQWVEIRDIEISNPDGYRTSHAMKFGAVRVQIDAASFRTDEPKVRLIRITESDISFERKLRTSNLQDLMENVSRLVDDEEPPREDETSLLIERMVIENTTVRLTLPLASTVATSSGNATLRVSDIVIENFGGGEQKSPAEAMQMFIAVILKTILENAGDILSAEALASLQGTMQDLPGDVASRASDAADAVGDVAATVSDELRQALGGVGDSVGDAAEGVRRGIGRILPGGQRDPDEDED